MKVGFRVGVRGEARSEAEVMLPAEGVVASSSEDEGVVLMFRGEVSQVPMFG